MPDELPDLAHVDWVHQPDVSQPVLVAAFAGWNDAGDAASSAVEYVQSRWGAQKFASIDSEAFYDFASTRPNVELDGDGQRHIVWPANEFSAAEIPNRERGIVTLTGIEPQLRWRTFTEQILGIARALDVQMVITLGALLAEVPHTRPVPVYGSTEDPDLAGELELTPSSYEGPTGIVGVLADGCRTAGIASASLWAAVPTYVPNATSPKAALALVERLTTLIGQPITTTDLEIAASSYERQVNEVVESDEETQEYVAQLEEHYDDDAENLDLSADSLVEEVERFLRGERE